MGDYGGTGYPTVMFLDAAGKKLMVHEGPRTVAGFEASLAKLLELQEQIRLAEAGDDKAKVEAFVLQLELGWLDFEEARAKLAELPKLSKKQAKEIEQLMTDAEVRALVKGAGKDAVKRAEAGQRCVAMWEEKMLPADLGLLIDFWSLAADHAEAQKDKKLFKKIIDAAKDTVRKDPRGQQLVQSLERRAKSN